MDSDPTTDGRSTGGAPRLPGRGEEPTQPPPSKHADNDRRSAAPPLPATGYGILASPRHPATTPTAADPAPAPSYVLPPSLPPEVHTATSFESPAAPTVVMEREAVAHPDHVAAPPVDPQAPAVAHPGTVVPTAGTPQHAAVAAGFAAGHVLGNPLSPHDPAYVEIDPNTGLPMHPTGPLTPTPQWKSRVPTKGKKVRNALLVAAVILVIVGLLWLLFRGFLPSGDGEGQTDETGQVATAVGDAEDAVADVNDRTEVDAALDELGLGGSDDPVDAVTDPTVPPSTVPSSGTYVFTWNGPSGGEVRATVDVASRDFTAVTGSENQIRRVDGRYYVRRADETWVVLEDSRAAGAIPAIGVDGPPTWSDLIPDVVDEFVLAQEPGAELTTAVLIDEAWLAELNPEVHEAWLGPWGLLDQPSLVPAVERGDRPRIPESAAGGEVLMHITTVRGSDMVAKATISSPAIGGTGTYELIEVSRQPTPVDVPSLSVGG